ncbi:MAG: hypothetical protein JW779_15320 [Candidatus Thorarchaeota archaeon]|nr:hypothetical protein [Candidatus Thorarchaeota archaeon]
MKLDYKHAIVILTLTFLLAAPGVAAANAGDAVIAQDIGGDFIFDLLENGAELVFTAVGPQGEPAVVYGQLGIPSGELGLTESMYDGCMLMALVATQGELLDYILDLVGTDLFGSDEGGEFFATQFGEEGFDFNSIFDMLGTDFNLLVNVFVNTEEAVAEANMAQITARFTTQFGFGFSGLLDLRIDESFFPPEMEIELPFDSIHVFIYQVTNTFSEAIDSVLSVMDDSGFLQSIDTDVFSTARAAGGGLIAIPDFGELVDLIDSFSSNETPSASSFLLSQMPDIEGPVAVAFVGYIGDQVLSTTSDEINIFEDLLGKSPTGVVNGLDNGQSLVVCLLPEQVNVISYSPENEAMNRTFYDNESNIVFWNATAFTDVPDYIISFEAGVFPPLITINRYFNPTSTTTGGSVQVTVAVHNEGTEPIYNVSVLDDGIATTYAHVSVTGTTSVSSAIVPAGGWLNMTYTVTFQYEGGYAFPAAHVTYDYNGTTYGKATHIDGYVVSPDPIGLLQSMFNDGMPFTGIAVGIIGLGAIVNIALMLRGRGAVSGGYQV